MLRPCRYSQVTVGTRAVNHEQPLSLLSPGGRIRQLLSLSFLSLVSILPLENVSRHAPNGNSCDVRGAYKAVDAPAGTLAITSLGEVQEISAVIVPTTLDAGTYEISVTRKGQDLYVVEGAGIYLRTFACFEYAYSQKAVFRYQGGNYVGAGKLIFE